MEPPVEIGFALPVRTGGLDRMMAQELLQSMGLSQQEMRVSAQDKRLEALVALSAGWGKLFEPQAPDFSPGAMGEVNDPPTQKPPTQALPTQALGWQLAPEPFPLSVAQYEALERLGPVLWQFLQGLNQLHRQSLSGQQPAWVAQWLDQGKPEALLRFAQMKRFRNDLPRVIRPDLLITEPPSASLPAPSSSVTNPGFALCEIDAVPGGLGFTSGLNALYRQAGFSPLEGVGPIHNQADSNRVQPPVADLPQAFWQMLCEQASQSPFVTDRQSPVVAIVISDEAKDYWAEMQWLAEHLQRAHGASIYVVHPRQLVFLRDALWMEGEAIPGGRLRIDLIYRFFELFDLPNIPQMELIQYAVKKGFVQCTPPFRPASEEKLSLALLHHPVLERFWRQHLGEDNFAWLSRLVPQTWVLDPTPLPPHATIAGLQPGGFPVQSFQELMTLSQKERELVIKPSGFSPQAWGSRGVVIGHDVSSEAWQAALNQALGAFHTTPHLLQRFHKPAAIPWQAIVAASAENTGAEPSAYAPVVLKPAKVRVRLCPYYLVMNNQPQLAGVLATACPADKKIIHGMKDAMLAPVALATN
ncbi:MAG: hypothetical protein SFZ03_03815 [Candidatus Melainabacteria bacterium]|nr:hypothetical protein [Candidatus Melainabacteria bacterium]